MPRGLFRSLVAVLLVSLPLAVTGCSGKAELDPGNGDPDASVDDVDASRPDASPFDPPADAAVDVCGDGVRGITEACDDRNTAAGDGCSADCLMVEPGHRCPTPGQDCVANRCGDRRIDPPEMCEDGNARAGDGCSASCQVEDGWTCPLLGAACSAAECGDGKVAGNEQCDDGDAAGGDGCSATCQLEPGFKCDVAGQDCQRTRCGDGVREGLEQCDNDAVPAGTLPVSFDGCDSYCLAEPICTGGACSKVCGDGIILPIPGQEQCDDGNVRDGDGCSAECVVETGYACSLQPTTPPASIALPLTMRDFKGQDLAGGHPDFEMNGGNSNIRFGLVTNALTNGRPTFNTAHQRDASKGDPGQASFGSWYLSTGTLPKTVTREISLTRNGTSYQFDSGSAGFFPLDNAGWASTSVPAGEREAHRSGHNFNFTTETHFWFQYDGTEVLTFSGDDDLWIYVNGVLCLDVGGLHPRRTAVMNLANPSASTVHNENNELDAAQSTTERGIVQACKNSLEATRTALGYNPLFEVSIFHAERHTNASNFRLTLTNFIKNSSQCDSTCGDGIVASDEVCDLGPGMNDGGYNGCLNCRELGPYCGDGMTQSPQETCDDGVNSGGYDRCGPSCTLDQYCGDGVRQPAFEDCDDGPNNGTGACTADCTLPLD